MRALLAALGVLTAAVAVADSSRVLDVPGFRPPTEPAKAFLDAVASRSARITVFPTVVRRSVENLYCADSRDSIIKALEECGIRRTKAETGHVDFRTGEAKTQLDVFRGGLKTFADYVDTHPIKTQYALVTEVLMTRTRRGGEAVGGIHCYIMDSDGKNVFSFLLNSHHRVFVEGDLGIPSLNPLLRRELETRATNVVVEALKGQLAVD